MIQAARWGVKIMSSNHPNGGVWAEVKKSGKDDIRIVAHSDYHHSPAATVIAGLTLHDARAFHTALGEAITQAEHEQIVNDR